MLFFFFRGGAVYAFGMTRVSGVNVALSLVCVNVLHVLHFFFTVCLTLSLFRRILCDALALQRSLSLEPQHGSSGIHLLCVIGHVSCGTALPHNEDVAIWESWTGR